MPYEVFVLQIITKYDLDELSKTIGKIKSTIERWCRPGMHAKRNIAFVIVTNESLPFLGRRLYPALTELMESGGVERFILSPDPGAVFTDHGEMDPLMHWLRLGRVEAGKRNGPDNMRNRKRG